MAKSFSLLVCLLALLTSSLSSLVVRFLKQYVISIVDTLTDVLVVPRRLVPRFTELTPEEVSDLWQSAQLIGRVIEKEYSAESLTLTIQDGVAAGQTVPHVHIHVIPRVRGDWMDNDDIYPAINGREKELAQELQKKVKGPDVGEERKPRSKEEMAQESQKLRRLLSSFEDVWSP